MVCAVNKWCNMLQWILPPFVYSGKASLTSNGDSTTTVTAGATSATSSAITTMETVLNGQKILSCRENHHYNMGCRGNGVLPTDGSEHEDQEADTVPQRTRLLLEVSVWTFQPFLILLAYCALTLCIICTSCVLGWSIVSVCKLNGHMYLSLLCIYVYL